MKYDPKLIEKKWQDKWENDQIFYAKTNSSKKKFYSLIEFPYPSGDGLHVGHVRSNVAMDIISHKRRREGYEVIYPIGWDAFGLPAENYAIKTGVHPSITTKTNTDNFRRQLKAMGFSFDWSREVNTTDPKYYKWTQWIFLKFLEKRLAYKKRMAINWCPKDMIGLANEEVVDGKCERCGTPVEKRDKEQWMLAITKYADRLDKDLDETDFLEKIKIQQRNWIGRSEGAEIDFSIKDTDHQIKVFTTRPDTLFGVTYVVLAPEHPLISKLKSKISNFTDVEKYIQKSKNKSEIDRTDTKKEKTGIALDGVIAINPANGKEIPVWIGDYVLGDYGTGAVMAVPAHDERDFEFAKKYKLPIEQVVIERMIDKGNPHVPGKEVVFRHAVIAAVRDPETGKYLCLKWKKHPWTTFVMGGVEGDEDPVLSAMREIREETGYKNVRLVKMLRDAQSEFYAAHKSVNRVAHTRNMIFELVSHERDQISTEEEAIHDVVWQTEEEIISKGMTHSEMPIFLSAFRKEIGAYSGEGVLINSGEFNYIDSTSAKKQITEKVGGKWITTYKLRDWVFSRQRYWGEPIPVVHCDKCGIVPVPESDLPVELPNVENYKPTDNGESPLALIDDWVNTSCPKCSGKAKRETDTMPQWAGSSWYYLRYLDPKNDRAIGDKDVLEKWLPVDWYNGGMEHTTLHLLYSRFWHKFLYDIGVVKTKEPYAKRTSHGLILAEGGVKMSKSKGNVVNPDKIIEMFGADSLRLYEMFMGPFDQPIAWNEDNIVGVRRFLERVFDLQESFQKDGETNQNLDKALHKTIQKISEDIEVMRFNTAVSHMMIYVNELEKGVKENAGKFKKLDVEYYESLLKILAPFAPHATEELWHMLGHDEYIHTTKWPEFDPKKIVGGSAKYAVQVNGKVRAVFEIDMDAGEEEAVKTAQGIEDVKKWLEGKDIKKIIFIKGKMVSFVI